MMSEVISEFMEDMKVLRDDLALYYKGDLRYPWSVVRMDLSNVDDDIPVVLSEITALCENVNSLTTAYATRVTESNLLTTERDALKAENERYEHDSAEWCADSESIQKALEVERIKDCVRAIEQLQAENARARAALERIAAFSWKMMPGDKYIWEKLDEQCTVAREALEPKP